MRCTCPPFGCAAWMSLRRRLLPEPWPPRVYTGWFFMGQSRKALFGRLRKGGDRPFVSQRPCKIDEQRLYRRHPRADMFVRGVKIEAAIDLQLQRMHIGLGPAVAADNI